MATPVRVRFRAEDIFDAPDDGKRYEVIDGDLYVTKSPDLDHQDAVGGLHLYIGQYVRQRRLGKVYVAPVGVILDDENGMQPDLVYVSQERAHLLARRGIYGAPDLVVEVLSAGTAATDRGIKQRRYAAAGIPHYWIVDPATRTLEAYYLGASGYELAGTYGSGAVFRPTLFPGLEIPIDDLWT